MDSRSTSAGACILLVAILLLSVSRSDVQADSPPLESLASESGEPLEETTKERKTLREKARVGITGPVGKTHYYWDKGFYIVSPRENIRIKIGGKIAVDGGYIGTDDELQRAFPDLEGSEIDLRRLSISASGTIKALSAIKRESEVTEELAPSIMDAITSYDKYDDLEFKFEMDFANVREIQDNWIRFPKIPLLRPFTFGHMKEPFSLEKYTSGIHSTFMEIALPTRAFSPGRNIGILYDKVALDERMTYALGGFLNTGSFSDIGEATDRMSDANGFNLTARVTGLPWYADEGKRLFHLGFSYSHQFRDESHDVAGADFRTRPESGLTDDRLVDTGELFVDGVDLITPELAIASGPLSFQGEYFHAFTDAKDDLDFWGYYVYGSYFLTGEHRNYDTSRGVFSRVRPKHNFRPFQGGWGAWEVALRYSSIDLNDKNIKGGKERNVTAGVNWYLTPHYRFMLNYIRALVKDRATPPAADDGMTDIFQVRFEIAY